MSLTGISLTGICLAVDVVISTYRRGGVKTLVRTLVPQLGPRDKIIVVWQGERCPLGLDKDERIVIITMRKPNLPAARNRGVKASAADIILFLDDDVVVEEGLLESHRACYGDESVTGVAGYVDDPLFDRDAPRPSFIDLSTGNAIQNFSLATSMPTICAMGANMSFRRQAILNAGGFDENYLRNALWEEADLCLRLLEGGGSLRYCSRARVTHLRKDSGGCRDDGLLAYLYHQFANTAYFAARFARPLHYGKWLRFWKYRLEFLCRTSSPGQPPRHDLWAVVAGALGGLAGILRFLRSRLPGGRSIPRVNRGAVADAVARVISEGRP